MSTLENTDVTDRHAVTNWAGNITFDAAEYARPESIDELAEVVVRSRKVRAVGSAHSFNRIADTGGIQVSTAGLPTTVDIDGDARTVTVNGGLRYGDFVEQLDAAGWAIHNLASLPHISVAGAVATGTHGSGDRNAPLHGAVAAVEAVTADGSIRRIARGDDDFDGAVVSLGLLGVVTRVTLDVEPAFEVRQDTFENLPWDQLLPNLDAITSSAYSVSLFTHWGDEGVSQAWLKTRMDADQHVAAADTFFGASAAERQRHPLPDLDGSNTTVQHGIPGRWWDRLPHFKLGFTPSNGEELQSEFLVPRRDAVAAIEAVRQFAPRMQPHLFVTELRTMAGDDQWMSPSHSEDCIGIHFTWKQHVPEVTALLVEIGAALAPLDARPHWGKLFDTAGTDVAALYPRLNDFRALADRYDPEGKFRNDFVDGLIFR